MKARFIRILVILMSAVGAMFSSGLMAADLRLVTNKVQNVRVALEQVYYRQTRRASVVFSFAVKEKGNSDRPDSLRLSLWAGSDVDDAQRDSITRLNSFFGVNGASVRPEEKPVPFQLTHQIG